MVRKGFPGRLRDTRGFTLVELLVVIAILGVLAGIAVKAYSDNRRRTYDTEAIAFMRQLLTAVETEAPTLAGAPNFGIIGTTSSGSAPLPDYPQLQLNHGMQLVAQEDAVEHKYQFYLAHRGGDYGFYFWIPGPNCTVEVDDDSVFDWSGVVKNVPADRIVPDMGSTGEYNWVLLRGAAGL